VSLHAQEARRRRRASYKKYQRNYQLEYQRQNPEKYRANARRSQLKRYGLTEADYAKMVEDRNGKCDLCRDAPSVLYVDHDHKSGKVRGLLCNRCNLALGLFLDRPEVGARVAAYLGGNLL